MEIPQSWYTGKAEMQIELCLTKNIGASSSKNPKEGSPLALKDMICRADNPSQTDKNSIIFVIQIATKYMFLIQVALTVWKDYFQRAI